MVVHPSVRLLLGLSLVFLSSALDIFPIAIFIAIASVWLFFRKDLVSVRWIRRARHLLILPPVIFGYTIAGTGILPFDVWAPTWEGLDAGLRQSLKLLAAILALRCAFLGLSARELLRGFIGLSLPFGRLGLDPERAARRLHLTWHYLETMEGLSARELLSGFRAIR